MALLLGAAGCATSTAASRSPTEVASTMERTRCGPGFDEASLAPLFDQRLVEGTQPSYVTLGGGRSGEQKRLTGAVLRVRPTEGMTPEWLDRALECHSAARVLGRIPESAVPNDPFWLPGSTVDIDVEPNGDSLAVTVRVPTPREAERVLERANAFVRMTASR
jgi:hypothetical protein